MSPRHPTRSNEDLLAGLALDLAHKGTDPAGNVADLVTGVFAAGGSTGPITTVFPSAAGQATTPKTSLSGWAEIVVAVGKRNNRRSRQQIKSLHDRHKSPIVFGKQGQQPLVFKEELLEWFDKMHRRTEELDNSRLSRSLETSNQYQHGVATGKQEIVVPGINGRVKRRVNATGGSKKKDNQTSDS